MSEVTKEYVDEKIDNIASKIDSLIELNERLIKQNMSLSGTVVQAPEEVKSLETSKKKKGLYYFNCCGTTIINGSGTFDVKETLKANGFKWENDVKSWKGYKTVAEVKVLFPGIEEDDSVVVQNETVMPDDAFIERPVSENLQTSTDVNKLPENFLKNSRS